MPAPRKVLFLDIDGPLIPYRPGARVALEPAAVALLEEVLAATGASLVISSTWREDGWDAVAELLDAGGLSRELMHEEWATAVDQRTRGAQIRAWLDRHPEVTRFAVLDDLHVTIEHLVLVPPHLGLQEVHRDRLIEILGREP